MRKAIICMLCLVGFSISLFSDQTNSTGNEPKYYENAKVVRVKYTSGESFVQRSYDEGFEQATVNLPVFEKDKAGTTAGRLEFYLGRSNYLRLDFDTEVIFSEIPALRTTNATLRVLKGGIYLDIDSLDAEKDIEVQTPDCGIFLLDRGIVRINVNEAGFTEVYVFEGTAEVAGDNTGRIVRANQKTIMAGGDFRERPFYFQSSDRDGFDQWNEQRNRTIGYSRQSASRYLESGYEDYEYELSHSGRWVYEPDYTTYIWIPYNITATWRPYWHGRWIWHPYYGYVWNSFDSWGWFTHYYGRWHWSYHYGWHWMPGYHWSPAWVSWFWNDYYYGWCPVNYWNKPLIVINKRWLRNYNYRKGIPIHSRSNIIIKKNQLSSSHIHKVALKRNALSQFSTKSLTYRGSPPRNQLKHQRIRMTDARGRQLEFKKGGITARGKSGQFRATGSQKRALKYSSRENASRRPFKSYRSTVKSRTPYRNRTPKSYRSQRSSNKGSSYRSYRGSRKSSSSSRKSYRRSSSSSRKRSGSGNRATKRKKDQPYYGSRTTRSTPQYRKSATPPSYSSKRKSYTSRSSRNITTQYHSSTRSNNRSQPRTYTRYRSRNQSTSQTTRPRTYTSRNHRSNYRSSTRSYNRSTTRSPSSRSYRSSRSPSRPTSRSYTRSPKSQPRSYSRSRRSSSSRSYSRSRSSSSRSRRSSSSRSRSSSSRSSSRSSGRKKN